MNTNKRGEGGKLDVSFPFPFLFLGRERGGGGRVGSGGDLALVCLGKVA